MDNENGNPITRMLDEHAAEDRVDANTNNILKTPIGTRKRSVYTSTTPSLSRLDAADEPFFSADSVLLNIGDDAITTIYTRNNLSYAAVIQHQQPPSNNNSSTSLTHLNDVKKNILQRINTNCEHKIMACNDEKALIYAEKCIGDILFTLVTKTQKMKVICDAIDKSSTLEVARSSLNVIQSNFIGIKLDTMQRIHSSCNHKIMTCNDETALIYAEKSICNILCILVINPEKMEFISEAINKVT